MSVQSSGSESTTIWKSSARAIGPKPSAAILEAMTSARADTVADHGEGTLAGDYRLLLERCGVVDRSQRGKLALSGSGALEFLNGQVTNELMTLRPGEGCYAAFLTHKGKMLGDLRILAVGDDVEAEYENKDA